MQNESKIQNEKKLQLRVVLLEHFFWICCSWKCNCTEISCMYAAHFISTPVFHFMRSYNSRNFEFITFCLNQIPSLLFLSNSPTVLGPKVNYEPLRELIFFVDAINLHFYGTCIEKNGNLKSYQDFAERDSVNRNEQYQNTLDNICRKSLSIIVKTLILFV